MAKEKEDCIHYGDCDYDSYNCEVWGNCKHYRRKDMDIKEVIITKNNLYMTQYLIRCPYCHKSNIYIDPEDDIVFCGFCENGFHVKYRSKYND